MGMTIGQGLLLGARNWQEGIDREEERKWRNEERDRLRRERALEDQGRNRLAQVPFGSETLPNHQALAANRNAGTIPTGSLDSYDPPTTTREVPLSESYTRAAQALMGGSGAQQERALQYAGMAPQARQLERTEKKQVKEDAVLAQVQDMFDTVLEVQRGLKAGRYPPALAMNLLNEAAGPMMGGKPWQIVGVQGNQMYGTVDPVTGKGSFMPITMEDANKYLSEARDYLLQTLTAGLATVSGEHALKAAGVMLEHGKVKTGERTAAVAERTAAVAERKAALDEAASPAEIRAKEALAGYYNAQAAYTTAGKKSFDEDRKARAAAQERLNELGARMEMTLGFLRQGTDKNGKPLTDEEKATLHRQFAEDRQLFQILSNRGKEESDAQKQFNKFLVENPKATPAEIDRMRTNLGLGEDPIMAGLGAVKGDPYAGKGAKATPAAPTMALSVPYSKEQFDHWEAAARSGDEMGKRILKGWIDDNVLSVGEKQRAQKLVTP